MQFHNPLSETYVPDEAPVEEALSRTTHMGIGAHQDDIEIMAYHGILECFGRVNRHFTSVTATNGAGSPRDDLYKDYTDEEMRKVRRHEQRKAAYDDDKVVFNVEDHENLAMPLVGVFDSQICGGKRYDLATLGRRRANATHLASHAGDESTSVIYGIDLTPLIEDETMEISSYIHGFIERFGKEVAGRIAKLI